MNLNNIFVDADYEVLCGAGFAQKTLLEFFPDSIKNNKVAIITDREVSGHYISEFYTQFEKAGISPAVIVVDGSEASKSIDSIRPVLEKLADIEFSLKDTLLVFGGGGVIDIASFVASIYMGGIQYTLIPTSFLAMIDSCMSKKAYLNYASHKNQLEVQCKPYRVLMDIDYLKTLPQRIFLNGYAQIVQYGLLVEPSLLKMLLSDKLDIVNMIKLSLSARAKLYAKKAEYREYGNKIAEVVEGHFRFLKYNHGEALSLGLFARCHTPEIVEIYKKYNLPMEVTGVAKDTLLKRMKNSMSLSSENKSLVCLKQIGEPYIREFSSKEYLKIFSEFLTTICQ